MKEFNIPVNIDIFRQTNQIWNDLKLNRSWSVGLVSTLIENKTFNNKEEWKEYYYNSGKERLQKLRELYQDPINHNQVNALYNFDENNKRQVLTINHKLNFNYGRTKKELLQRAEILYNHCKDFITLKEAYLIVEYRIIGETWNGIILREKNTIKNLETLYPFLTFKKTEGERDYKYGVDYEVYYNNNLIIGLQIKPLSYKNNSPVLSYINDVMEINKIKNQLYYKEYNAKVINVFSNTKGEINNIYELISILDKCKQ